MDNGDKLMWKYMFDNGGIITSRSYYGTITDCSLTDTCRAAMLKYGIDWDKTKPVEDDANYEFAGTFADSQRVTFLEGVLVTNDGKKWKWYYEFDDFPNILDLIKDIIPDPFEGKEIY